MGKPIINDVATDLEDPPQFVTNQKLNPLPDAFKPQIEKFYVNLRPAVLKCSKEQAFNACKEAAGKMPRWKLTHEDPEAGVIEGVASTALLRFKDDFTIRLRKRGDDMVIDMRSKSRLGKGDLGANAQRIESYLDLVRKEIP